MPWDAKKHDVPTKRSQKEAGTAESPSGDDLYIFLSTAKLGSTSPWPVLVNALIKVGTLLNGFGHLEHHGKGYTVLRAC